MISAKKLAAAAILGAALFAVPEPAEAQSGCELLYLKWEGCATDCDSYYESTVLRAVCRGWCLVEYLYDYWTCESNVEGPAAEADEAEESPDRETPPEESPPEESPPEASPNAEDPAAFFLRGGSGFAPATPPPPGETSPTELPGARRAVFRRSALRPCAAAAAPLRRMAPERAPTVAAPAPRRSHPDAGTDRPARRSATAAEQN